MATAVAARHTLTEALQRAIAAEEFVLHYQPIVEVATGRMTGLESLVRWMHPTRGMIWPGEFIAVAESSDLILDIGRWVLDRSCRQAKEWHDRYPELRDLQISVNVAARQLEQPDFVEQVAEVVRSSGVDPATVVLEVTETTLLQNADDAIAKLGGVARPRSGHRRRRLRDRLFVAELPAALPGDGHQDRARFRRGRRSRTPTAGSWRARSCRWDARSA